MGISPFELLGFGPRGWGAALLLAAFVTLAVSATAFLIGALLGTLGAWGKISGGIVARTAASTYTVVLRGVPDLLVIYLFYFGGSAALSWVARLWGAEGFVGVPAFATGALAVGIISGAYQTEVYRGAYQTLSKGELEAARACGMRGLLLFRRIVAPQVLRYALPGLGNCWQLALKESALVSVTGLVELLRQAQVASGSTRQPFTFYLAAAALYLVLTTVSTVLFDTAEKRTARGLRRA
jgi:octopine/nopaline transport system permease protein